MARDTPYQCVLVAHGCFSMTHARYRNRTRAYQPTTMSLLCVQCEIKVLERRTTLGLTFTSARGGGWPCHNPLNYGKPCYTPYRRTDLHTGLQTPGKTQCSDHRFLRGLPAPRAACVCVHVCASTAHHFPHTHTFETYQDTHSALSQPPRFPATQPTGGERRESTHVLGPASKNEFNWNITNH